MSNIGTLKNGIKIISLIPYAVLFNDRTFLTPCPKEVVEELTPKKKEVKIILPSGVPVIKVVWYLTEHQKSKLENLQKGNRFVLVSRVILDALNENPEERINRFSYCVGQKPTEATANSKTTDRVMDTSCWMY